MRPRWLAIRQARSDLTDYLIHWTRRQIIEGKYVEAFDVLKRILASGYLKPSFGPRMRATARSGIAVESDTIKGEHPAVCFTEQPLGAFIISCDTLPDRYHPYGIAVRKDRLFEYGGRPVIYGDEDQLNGLPEDHKHLWVRLQPTPNPDFGRTPVDWTQEREWRVRVNSRRFGPLGVTPDDGVPLLLPPDYDKSGRPIFLLRWVLVNESREATELKGWIEALPNYDGDNGVLRRYFDILPTIPIVPLDVVRRHLDQGDTDWSRLDTLPIEQIQPKVLTELIQSGWRRLQ